MAPTGFARAYVAIVDVAPDGVAIGWYSAPGEDRRAFIAFPGQGVQRLMDVDTSPDAILRDIWHVTPEGYLIGHEADPANPIADRVVLLKR